MARSPTRTTQDPGDCLTTPMVTYAGVSLPLYGSARTFQDAPTATPVAVAGARPVAIRRSMVDGTVVRVGYDLFDEVNHLLTNGQPAQNAGHPALEIHISLLRQEIVLAGIPLLEIPAVPAGSPFHACLTHDIDFVGIRHHFLDHTMWGFAYRATVGAVAGWLRGTTSFRRLLGSWCAVLKLPLVYLRLARISGSPLNGIWKSRRSFTPHTSSFPIVTGPARRFQQATLPGGLQSTTSAISPSGSRLSCPPETRSGYMVLTPGIASTLHATN